LNDTTSFFPAFERFVERHSLVANASGILAVKLPRILGQGQTRAKGLDMPPALVEKQQMLASLELPRNLTLDREVENEIAEAKRAFEAQAEQLRNPDNRRRFALHALHQLEGVTTGNKDNQFFAGRLVLVSDKVGQNWAWAMTSRYPVISKIPPDIDYVVAAYPASLRIVEKWTLPVEQFVERLRLAWTIARHFSADGDVLISDVARLFKIAIQSERFWGSPARRNFDDVPEAVFIANLINWRRHGGSAGQLGGFELVPATVNQSHGPRSRSFFVPDNAEGTVVRPFIYIRRN
jgi:hypothetical protein